MSLVTSYNLRHLATRSVTAILTVSGLALVVFVFATTFMLADGLRDTLGSTGSSENVIVTSSGAQNEIQSAVPRENANVILTQPEVKRGPEGSPLATQDTLVLKSLKKRSDGQPSNVNIRGTSLYAASLRPGFVMRSGRMPAAGTQEIVVGSAIDSKFSGVSLGESIRLVGTEWKVVGVFDAGNSAFTSEIWGDADVLMPAFHREKFSSLTFSLAPNADFEALKGRLENDRRLNVQVKREREFYADQSKTLSTFITFLGAFVSIIFSIGAIIGAMITMDSAVANRTREIGILRAIGFSRSAIMLSFLGECALIGLVAGIFGLLLASFMTFVHISTTNFQTFSEVAFGFKLTAKTAVIGLCFGVVMGLVGGLLPALKAARISLLSALRAV